MNSSKCFKCFNICTTYDDYLWPTFQLNQTLLIGVIVPKNPKMGQNGSWTKKTLSLLLAKVKNGKYPKTETWYPNSIDGWSYYRLCENLWMTFWAMVAISTQQKKFFGLIFQELCDFSRAIWKSWHWNLSIGIGIGIDLRI